MYLETLTENRDGTLNVSIRHSFGNLEEIEGVNRNIVRCAVGDDDMQYLIDSDFEEMCTPVSDSEYKDFKWLSYEPTIY